MNNTESMEPTQTNQQELEPPLLLAILGLCLGISDWVGLQLIETPAFSLLITPQLYGMGIGLIIGLGLFFIFFRKERSRADLLLVTRAVYRILLLFLLSTLILSMTLKFSPATFLFTLGTGLGVISGILTISSLLWFSRSNSSSVNGKSE